MSTCAYGLREKLEEILDAKRRKEEKKTAKTPIKKKISKKWKNEKNKKRR